MQFLGTLHDGDELIRKGIPRNYRTNFHVSKDCGEQVRVNFRGRVRWEE